MLIQEKSLVHMWHRQWKLLKQWKALKMAISGLRKGPDCHFQLTHHSDRGIQYCSDKYIKLLENNNIRINPLGVII